MAQQAPVPSEIPVDNTEVYLGDCLDLIRKLPDNSIDIVVTSPPYWGQRKSAGTGTEADPRDYLAFLQKAFESIHTKLKREGIIWINMGDSYNTPINWGEKDYKYSSLGPDRKWVQTRKRCLYQAKIPEKGFHRSKGRLAHIWEPADATPTARCQPHRVKIPLQRRNNLVQEKPHARRTLS